MSSRILCLLSTWKGPKWSDLVVEEEVLEDGQLGNECEVLVDRLDPVCGGILDRLEMHFTTPDKETARVLRRVPAQDLDERALACAIVADQAKHLARVQGEVYAAEHRERSEALRHALDFEDYFGSFGYVGSAFRGSDRPGDVVHHLSSPLSARPRPRGQAVEPPVQGHRDDHYDADVHEEVVGADPDDVKARLRGCRSGWHR